MTPAGEFQAKYAALQTSSVDVSRGTIEELKVKAEIVEALQVAVLTGGVPTWSVAKKGITKLFEEWDEEEATCPKK